MNDKAIKPYFEWAHAKRPEFEFFNIMSDPSCLNNLAGLPEYEEMEREMKGVLLNELQKSKDPRVAGPDEGIFDTYIRYSPMREFPKP
jgi:N-sulfoglucosamine sulfohydrolase